MNNPNLASFHAMINGRVQGVFFRDFVRSSANALGLTGYVRNVYDFRSVEVQAEGERGKLEELLTSLHQGPSGAKVEKVEASWKDYSGDFTDFSIKY